MILWWQLKRWVLQVRFWELLFAPVGIGWTLAEIGNEVGHRDLLAPFLPYLWCLFGVGIFIAWWLCWPQKSVVVKLHNIDTEIEVKVGDIFRSGDPIVVTVPTTLEVTFENKVIDRTSIQGQYTINYFHSERNFLTALEVASKHVTDFERVTNYYSGQRKVKKFLPGEVFVLRDAPRVGYIVTFATFNEHGVVQIEPSEFVDLLPRLWLGIRERGDVGNITVPLMGSRFGRTGFDNRKDILREQINSFSAASSEARLADRVTFYITPSDFTQWGFSFDYIKRLLDNVCDDHIRRDPVVGEIGSGV